MGAVIEPANAERHGSTLLFRAEGFSMEPFLLDGDQLIVEASCPGRWGAGDILLYRSADYERPVAHRLVRLGPQPGALVLRPDAYPTIEESVDAEAVVGRVDFVRRAGSLRRVGGGGWAPWINRAIVALWPRALALKELAATPLSPAVARLQASRLYRRLARRQAAAIAVRPLPSGDGLRLVATIRGRYAASADLQVRDLAGGRSGWLSSVFVRTRYRGLGLDDLLLREAERHAALAGAAHVRLEVRRGNRAAEALYRARGYAPERLGGDDEPSAIWQKALCP